MIQPILGYLVVLLIVAAVLTVVSWQQRRRRWERWEAETQEHRFDGRRDEPPRRGRRIGLRIVVMLLAVAVLVLLFFVVVALYGLLTHQVIQFP